VDQKSSNSTQALKKIILADDYLNDVFFLQLQKKDRRLPIVVFWEDAAKKEDGKVICCTLKEKEDLGICTILRKKGNEYLNQILSSELADFIFGRLEPMLLWQMSQYHLVGFSFEQISQIQKKAQELIHSDHFVWGLFTGAQSRHQRLRDALEEYFQDNDRFDLAGFVLFRMSGYQHYLLSCLIYAAEEVLSLNDDEQYLELLRNYVKSHASRQMNDQMLHLVLSQDDLFYLFAEEAEGKNLCLRFIEDGKIKDSEYLIIWRLLLLSPQKLMIHTEPQITSNFKKIVHMLQDIFKDAIYFCYDCQICHNILTHS